MSEVFERLADLPRYGEWMHRTGLFRACSLTSEVPIREGSTYVDSTRMGRFDGQVIEFVPPTRIAFKETLRWFGSPMTQARPSTPWRETSPRTRPPRGRRGALWLDEVHEACRRMDGESGAEQHPGLPQAFPGVRLDVRPEGPRAAHRSGPDRDSTELGFCQYGIASAQAGYPRLAVPLHDRDRPRRGRGTAPGAATTGGPAAHRQRRACQINGVTGPETAI